MRDADTIQRSGSVPSSRSSGVDTQVPQADAEGRGEAISEGTIV